MYKKTQKCFLLHVLVVSALICLVIVVILFIYFAFLQFFFQSFSPQLSFFFSCPLFYTFYSTAYLETYLFFIVELFQLFFSPFSKTSFFFSHFGFFLDIQIVYVFKYVSFQKKKKKIILMCIFLVCALFNFFNLILLGDFKM